MTFLFWRRWPDGEPLMIGAERVGTMCADGSLIFAAGLDVEISDLQRNQAVEPKSEKNQAEEIQRQDKLAR
jgi:hypothetical protein